MKIEKFRKEIIKNWYIDRLTSNEIANRFNLTPSIISKIIYDDASNDFKLLKLVKEEYHGRT